MVIAGTHTDAGNVFTAAVPAKLNDIRAIWENRAKTSVVTSDRISGPGKLLERICNRHDFILFCPVLSNTNTIAKQRACLALAVNCLH